MLGPPGEVEAYWNGSRIQFCTDLSIPAATHGDGNPTTKVGNLFTQIWPSRTSQGPTIDTKFIYTVVKKSDLVDGTLELLWDRFAWAMDALLHGVVPEWEGRKLTNAGNELKTKRIRTYIESRGGGW